MGTRPPSRNYDSSNKLCLSAHNLCFFLTIVFDVKFRCFLGMMGGVV
jgi:hypothetical protein